MPEPLREAAASLKDPAYLATVQARNDRVLDHDRADPRVVKFARAFIKAAQAHGIPVMAAEIYRSPERQQDLLLRKVTKAGPGESAHQHGLAVDLVHARRAWNLTPDEWSLFGVIGKEIARRQNLKVRWGGADGDGFDWDPAHWELLEWRSMLKS